MAAGKYDRRIRIERLATSIDSYGQPLEGYTLQAETWAKFEPMGGSEAHTESSVQRASTQRAKFRIRFRTGIEPRMRILWREGGSQVWEIEDVTEDEGRRRELVLTCYSRQVVSGG